MTYWKRPWCWERVKTGGEGDNRMRWLDSSTNTRGTSLSKLIQETVTDRAAWHAAVHGVIKSWAWRSGWTATRAYSWASRVVLVEKNPPAKAGDVRDIGSIPGLGRCLEEGMATTPVSLPGEPHEKRNLVGRIHGAIKCQTRLKWEHIARSWLTSLRSRNVHDIAKQLCPTSKKMFFGIYSAMNRYLLTSKKKSFPEEREKGGKVGRQLSYFIQYADLHCPNISQECICVSGHGNKP